MLASTPPPDPDRETPGMEIGAVAEIGEDVLRIGERREAHPGHTLATHMGIGFGVAIHPYRHEVAADAGCAPGCLPAPWSKSCEDTPSRNTACA